MSTKILISPYSARLFSGRPSPKNYPHWRKLVELLNKDDYEVVQIGISGEDRIEGVSQFITNWPFDKLKDLVNDCAAWIAVDNFFQHFANCERLKRGIVLFGQSDDRVFGYPQNINLLRGRDYLRQWQFQSWEEAEDRPDSFVYAENIMSHVYELAPPPLAKRAPILSSYASTS